MIARFSKSASSGPIRSSTTRPLKRGKACSVCRSLKIKCDGKHPTCGPCMRNPKADVCEWDRDLSKSKVAILTETIETLKARIVELQNPGLFTPAVILHDPYGVYRDKHCLRSPFVSEPPNLGPHSPLPPTLTVPSLPSDSSGSPSSQPSSIPSASSIEVRMDFNEQRSLYSPHTLQEPPRAPIHFLIEKFLPHATELGFFLDIPSFYRSALIQQPFGHHLRPTPALLTTVYLWGMHLSHPKVPPQIDEPSLLIRAMHHVVTDTLGTHPKRIMHTLQAEVLLATYFFRMGRFLESKARLESSVSLVLSAQMHRLRSSHDPPCTVFGLTHDTPPFPENLQDATDEGEQINGFWVVLALHKTISFALHPSMSICGALEAPGLQIDTPWPFDSADYRNGYLTSKIQGNNTVKTFLSGLNYDGRNDTSITTLAVKASILCHKATYLAEQWNPHMQKQEIGAFTTSFDSANQLIDNFRPWVPQFSQPGVNTTNIRTILLTHSLMNAAIIKLHEIFSHTNEESNRKCVQAACDMVNFDGINLRSLGFVNSVYGVLWRMACQVLINEILRRQTTQAMWSTSIGEESLRHYLDTGLLALATFSDECTYIRYQRIETERAYATINTSPQYF